MLSLDVKLLHYYANELCRAKGDHTPVGKNWHHKFYERNPSVKTLRARPMEKARLINEDLRRLHQMVSSIYRDYQQMGTHSRRHTQYKRVKSRIKTYTAILYY